MRYLLLCLAFLAATLLVAAISRARRPRASWPVAGMAVAAIALLALTAVFDSLMIAAGLFDYADGLISGVRVGLAPVEDFAYPLAGVILLPAVWILLGRRDDL